MKKVDIIQILLQLAILGVMAGTLIPIAQQSDAANKQANLLGNQTAYLAEQTRTLKEDYEKRTRAYLAVDGITVQQGNSSEYVDILISIKNFGQVPATKLTFGNVTEDQRGIIIAEKMLHMMKVLAGLPLSITAIAQTSVRLVSQLIRLKGLALTSRFAFVPATYPL